MDNGQGETDTKRAMMIEVSEDEASNNEVYSEDANSEQGQTDEDT